MDLVTRIQAWFKDTSDARRLAEGFEKAGMDVTREDVTRKKNIDVSEYFVIGPANTEGYKPGFFFLGNLNANDGEIYFHNIVSLDGKLVYPNSSFALCVPQGWYYSGRSNQQTAAMMAFMEACQTVYHNTLGEGAVLNFYFKGYMQKIGKDGFFRPYCDPTPLEVYYR